MKTLHLSLSRLLLFPFLQMCNEWAIDTPCPAGGRDFCQSMHILDSRGNSVLASILFFTYSASYDISRKRHARNYIPSHDFHKFQMYCQIAHSERYLCFYMCFIMNEEMVAPRFLGIFHFKAEYLPETTKCIFEKCFIKKLNTRDIHNIPYFIFARI